MGFIFKNGDTSFLDTTIQTTSELATMAIHTATQFSEHTAMAVHSVAQKWEEGASLQAGAVAHEAILYALAEDTTATTAPNDPTAYEHYRPVPVQLPNGDVPYLPSMLVMEGMTVAHNGGRFAYTGETGERVYIEPQAQELSQDFPMQGRMMMTMSDTPNPNPSPWQYLGPVDGDDDENPIQEVSPHDDPV